MDKVKNALLDGIDGSELEITDFVWYGGEASYENVEMLMETEAVKNADMIFAVGGRTCNGHLQGCQRKT